MMTPNQWLRFLAVNAAIEFAIATVCGLVAVVAVCGVAL